MRSSHPPLNIKELEGGYINARSGLRASIRLYARQIDRP